MSRGSLKFFKKKDGKVADVIKRGPLFDDHFAGPYGWAHMSVGNQLANRIALEA